MYTNSVKHIRIQKRSKNLYNTKICSTFAKPYFNNTMEYEITATILLTIQQKQK